MKSIWPKPRERQPWFVVNGRLYLDDDDSGRYFDKGKVPSDTQGNGFTGPGLEVGNTPAGGKPGRV